MKLVGKPPCSYPGCTEPGVIRIEHDKWMCMRHTKRLVSFMERVSGDKPTTSSLPPDRPRHWHTEG